MALISCPECGHEVSDRAEACPNCGFPIAEEIAGVCPDCGNAVTTLLEPCPHCGNPLQSEPASDVANPAVGAPPPQSETVNPADKMQHPVDTFLAGSDAAPDPATPQTSTRTEPVVAKPRKSGLVRFWLWSLPVVVIFLAALPQTLPVEDYLTFPFIGSLVDVDELSLQFGLSGLIAWAGLSIYWAPTLVAFGRFAVNKGWVLAINLFLGWTVLAWIIAFAMAASSPKDPYESIKPVEY